jgi:hypothetical protein
MGDNNPFDDNTMDEQIARLQCCKSSVMPTIPASRTSMRSNVHHEGPSQTNRQEISDFYMRKPHFVPTKRY